MDPITEVAAKGLGTLTEYGIAGLLFLLLAVGTVFVLRYFMQHCEKRTDETFKALAELNDRSTQAVEKNTDAFHGVQLAIVKLEARLEK